MLTHHATRPGELDWLLNRSANLYVEKLERRDGTWVIAQRGGAPAYAPTGVTAVKSDDPAVRWLLDRGKIIALWGARHPRQLDPVDEVMGWTIDTATMAEIDRILADTIKDPVGPEFMAPPPSQGA